MAKSTPSQNQNQVFSTVSNTFSKGMFKDYNDTFVGEGLYTHARNAVNNSHDGQVGTIGNEPSNLLCSMLPYDLIGCIHLADDQWAVFTTDDTDSEIGVFDESACKYSTAVNDRCLGFKRSNLVTGVYRKRYDCERLIYFADGLNADRFLDLDNIPYKYTQATVNDCLVKTELSPRQLDCEKIRIAALVAHPTILLTKGVSSGTLPNGSYQACIAYTINKVKVTDYFGLSEVQSLFSHENVSSSLEIKISSIDTSFDEFELVLLTNINQQSVAKKIGVYTTSQGTIYVDRWDIEYETVPISQIVVRTTPVEKSDAMYNVNNYLLRVGTYSKYKFNYQQQASKITANWVAVEYPADYYHKGGNNTGYMRDEQYAFFIRWIYNTGERSESYHIPGRSAVAADETINMSADAYEASAGIQKKNWQVVNTASVDNIVSRVLDDGGVVTASGKMGYWQSTELYPADHADVWGTLCGKPIRHHKFPDVTIAGGSKINHFDKSGTCINIMGVEFTNITHPLDQNGLPITSIVGYEILRGSREANKSIIAKGLLNNMREYAIPGNSSTKGLYQNYPYNDLGADYYYTSEESIGIKGSLSENLSSPLNVTKQNIFSFHSPETSFTNPFLNSTELKIYQECYGNVTGSFTYPHLHPKFKIPNNFLNKITDLISILDTIKTVKALYGKESFGIDIKATEDYPVDISLTMPPAPKYPYGGSGLAKIADIAYWVLEGGLYVTAVLAFIALEKAMADIKKEKLLSLFSMLIKKRQFALQYSSHGFYNESLLTASGNQRKKITESAYIHNNIQSFSSSYSVNNLHRSGYVIVQTEKNILDPVNKDDTRKLITQFNTSPNTEVQSKTAAHYGALKVSMGSQYGQLESVKQLPISFTVHPSVAGSSAKSSTPILFGGDTYINRFTEKNTMFFFNTWLMGEPDEMEFDYRNYENLPYTRFWVNSQKIDVGVLESIAKNTRHLNGTGSTVFSITDRYFYLFNSGVRDFFVESEVNTAYRDWDDTNNKRHYDPYRYTDLNTMFRSDIIKSGEYYKYDYSLSINKLFNSHISWGELLQRDYNSLTAASCYTYQPNRTVYSLPQQDESKKDNWRVYLANNYKDFPSRVTAIKSVNKTGALFMMKYMSPLQFMGVEQLKLDGTGAKITIGDGALFSGPQQLQSIVNSDEAFEYGSNQSKFASLGTTHGVFWVSQNQGKIFQYAGQIKEISNDGMKWWFAKYLPSELLKAFPDYPLYDNPVKGVGVQMIYDNTHEIIYITKKDYKPLTKDMKLGADGRFYLGDAKNKVYVEFDSVHFENASWTVSYDPKSKGWISFHDWIPSFLIPGKAHFMSVKGNSIWKHNVSCNSYCNFYGINYPFEVEFVSSTGQTVTSMRSIEYMLEMYKLHNDCADRFHVLDENFDQAIVYNSEQVSGLLEMSIKAKNNPLTMLTYPQVGANSIKINYAKEENKYRFNQFWDITKNRGEFTQGTNVPMFNTKANGYEFPINAAYVNYSKSTLERKKFRHNVNRVFLRKFVSNDLKILFKISNQKIQQSLR